MTHGRRGVLAAFFVSTALIAGGQFARAAVPLAPGETVLPDGMTVQIRHATAAGAVALEVWIRCPADGWKSSEPGIARLTALSVIASRNGGESLRDAVEARGGRLAVSVFQTATEIAVSAPAPAAGELEDALLRAVFHGSIDNAAFDDAGTRLAAEQADVRASTDEILRERVFSAVFASGPLHDSTFGDAGFLTSATIEQVRAFAADSYVAGAAAFVAIGNADPNALRTRLNTDAPPPAPGRAIPASSTGSPGQAVDASTQTADAPGVALAWAGPAIDDERAATAMDFLSDYLADEHAGTFTHAANAVSSQASVGGQFVTLESPGLFFVSVSGPGVDPAAMDQTLRQALAPVLDRPLDARAFAAALAAYRTRLLRQMDAPEGLADNYGWYFAQGAPAYAPSATDASLGGAYFANAASLTPGFVHDIARRYLGQAPVVITVQPAKTGAKTSAGGS